MTRCWSKGAFCSSCENLSFRLWCIRAGMVLIRSTFSEIFRPMKDAISGSESRLLMSHAKRRPGTMP